MSNRKLKGYRGTVCLNCEHPLDISDRYCPNCGQINSTKKITVADFIEEFFGNFYAYDSRLRNSVVSLLTKPGCLAKEYVAGKRQHYANPFRLFLSVAIVFFVINNILSPDILPPTEKVNLSKLSRDSIYKKSETYEEKTLMPLVYTITSFRNYQIKYPTRKASECFKELGYENTFAHRLLFKKATSFKSNNIEEELTSFVKQNLPLFFFLSLPIIALGFWLVSFLKYSYTDNLVFTYSFSTVLFLWFIVFSVMDWISNDLGDYLLFFSFFIFFPIFFYKSIKNFYGLTRLQAIFKFVLLNVLFGIFAGLALVLILLFGILIL